MSCLTCIPEMIDGNRAKKPHRDMRELHIVMSILTLSALSQGKEPHSDELEPDNLESPLEPLLKATDKGYPSNEVVRSQTRFCLEDLDCIRAYNHSFMFCKNAECTNHECSHNGDCSQGQACIRGNCITIPVGRSKYCTQNRECPIDFLCHVRRNMCAKDSCITAQDCPGDMACLRRRCRGQPCRGDTQCPPGELCEADHCLGNVTKAKSCAEHSECTKRSHMCSSRFERCSRLICEEDKNCPSNSRCHSDRWSGYCSDFICRSNSDCLPKDCQEEHSEKICANLEKCNAGKCELSRRCGFNSDCPNDHVCLKHICAQVLCSEKSPATHCPKNSKCNLETGWCKSIHCTYHSDCLPDQKCQHRICVAHRNGDCDLHVDCPLKQVCEESQCATRTCHHDKDCQHAHLVCHPDHYCTANEDFVVGMHMEKARQKSGVSDLLVKPLAVKTDLPVDKETLAKLTALTTQKMENHFPSLEDLLKSAWETTQRDEEMGLEEGCSNQSSCPKSPHRSMRRPREASYEYSNETIYDTGNQYNYETLNEYGSSSSRRHRLRPSIPANIGVQRRPLARNLQGDPAFKAASRFSDVFLSTTEKLAQQLGLNPIQAAVGLGRQRANCIWKNDAQLRVAEYPQRCTATGFSQVGVDEMSPRIYRSHSGACNNLHPSRRHFGLLSLPFDRLIRGDYHDGISKFRRSRFDGSPLPNPRVLSLGITKVVRRSSGNRGKNLEDPNVNSFFVFFGQFLAHDFSNTLVRSITGSTPVFGPAHTARGSGAATTCCGPLPPSFDVTNANNTANTFIQGNSSSRGFCIPFKIPPNDPYWKRKAPNKRWECMSQITTGSVPPFSCKLGPRQIMTQISHWLDLSQIYNSKKTYFDTLNRRPSSHLLQTSANNYMPLCFATAPPPGTPVNSCPACLQSARRNGVVSRANCFIGGDFRTNENLGLAAIQTVFVRYHNFVATKLPVSWDTKTKLEESRRIIIAVYQHIIYNEYLPLLIGPRMMRKYKLFPRRRGYSRQYNRRLDVAVMNVFATASFRFGHAMIPDQITVLDESLKNITTLNPHNLVFDWFRFRVNRFESDLIRGMISTPAGRVDGFFTRAAREIFNFDSPAVPFAANNGGNDLLAWNINRGRDHGLSAFHQYVKLTRGEDIRGWKWFTKNLIYGRPMTALLKKLYKSYKDTDTYILGLLEKPPARGGRRLQVLGPTHANIVGSQFARFRRADRFFYEEGTDRASRFLPRELAQIKKATMAKVLCDTVISRAGNANLRFPVGAFRRVTGRNPYLECQKLPSMDWSVFKTPLSERLKAGKR